MKRNNYLSHSVNMFLLRLILLIGPVALYAQAPRAGFTVSSVQGCAPFSVNFTNTSTGAVSYSWDFGNGNYSSIVNPQNVYVSPGTYSVRLIAVAANGSTDTLTMSNLITAMPGPQSSFSINTVNGCAGITGFQFTNTSSGAVSYFWDFGDGTSSLSANPSKTYSTPGPREVKLRATNAAGCHTVYTYPQSINVHPLPVAGFSASPVTSCTVNQVFQFTSTSANVSSYLWDFGDGTTSSQANPSKTYGSPGTYRVTLKVTNSGGCTDSLVRTGYITIHEPLQPRIIVDDSLGCIPFKPRFSTNITGATNYTWNFGNGQASSASNFRPTYSQPGQYDVTLSVTMPSGCTYTASAPGIVTVRPQPVANFTIGNSSGCVPITPAFNNLSPEAHSYRWNFGDNTTSTDRNPNKTYTNAGTYTVELFVYTAEGCSASFRLNNSVTAIAPAASFDATGITGCPPVTTTFTNTSTGATSFLWLFGDGTSSQEPDPVKVFEETGSYDVTLIAINANGCRDTLVVEDYIRLNYEAAYYTPPPSVSGCAPLTASFENTDINAVSWFWDFGDGHTSTLPNPTHVFSDAGTYHVSLVVGNGTDCAQFYEIFQTVIVEGGTPIYTVNIDPCPPFEVTFTDTTPGAVSWEWDFGDGTSSTEQSPRHIFENTNIHHVSLTVITSTGCSNSYVGFNAVNFSAQRATFSTSYEPGAFPRTVYFQSTNPGATSWFWDFGDGATSTEENPVHVYETEAQYEVTLIINSDSCELRGSGGAFANNSIEAIAENPTGDPGKGGSNPSDVHEMDYPLSGCAPLIITFFRQDTSHVVVQWDFGDGNTSTLTQPQHTYNHPGLYNVSYIAMTPAGLDTFAYNQGVLVGGEIPDFTFTQQNFCSHSQVTVNTDVQHYQEIIWRFGGSTLAYTPEASHNFPVSNSASSILLTVKDSLGCNASRLRSIYTNPPFPAIVYPRAVCKDTVFFSQTLVNPAGYSFLWDFGDGTTSQEFEPAHYYNERGEYEIKLTVTDPSGCTNTITLPDKITVYIPVAEFSVSGPSSGCAPFTARFNNTSTGMYSGSGSPFRWWWNLGSGAPSDPSSANRYTYTEPGVYTVRLEARNTRAGGCRDTQTFEQVITVYPAAVNFTFIQSSTCLPLTAEFTGISEDVVSWEWNFGNGITSNEQNPVMTFTTAPADTFSLTIETINGCRRTRKKTGLRLYEARITAAYTGQCNPLPVLFSGTGQNTAGWEWDFGDGTTATGQSPSHLYTENGTYMASVIGTDINQCRDTAYLEIPILVSGPITHFHSPTPASCAPSVVEFFDSSAHAVGWEWDFGDGTSSNIKNPVKLYDRPGVYDVRLITFSSDGCSDTLLYPDYVTVLGPATAFSVSMQESCEGATARFTDNSRGAVEWEWNFGEGNISHEQHPSFTYNRPGVYVITLFSKDTIGCTGFYTIPEPLVIHPRPRAGFQVSDSAGCAPFSFTTTNLSEGASSYRWSFNNQQAGTGTSPGFTFINPGFYTLTLVATSEFGCKDTASIDSLEAYKVPVAGFTLNSTEGCTPLSVTFNNTSYNTDSPTYRWVFGNDRESNEISPTEVYYNPGFYNVELHVTNGTGCSGSVSLPSIVQVFDTLPAPVSPILRVTVESPTSVFIEWEQSVAPDFGSYRLLRKNSQTGQFERIAELTELHTLSYTDRGLNTFHQVYCYKLETTDRCGYYVETENLTEHCTINIESTTQPDNTIAIEWTPYVGKTPSQYRVFRSEENFLAQVEDIGVVPGDVTSFTDTTVFCPVKYRYSVRAEGLNGQWHVESNSDYDICQPIRNLFEHQQVHAARSTVVEDEFILTEWTPPAIMAHKVTGYRILKSIDNVNFYETATVPAQQRSYIDREVQVSKMKYYYRVMATNDCGLEGQNGQFSDNIVLRTRPSGDYQVELNWTPYTGWGVNGVSFYIIERENPDGTWEIIRQVPGSVTTIVDEN